MAELKPRESHLRSILKAISWRLIATATTFLLALFIFRHDEDVLEKSGMVAGLELFLKLLIYYLHERAWQAVPSGRIRRMFGMEVKKEG